jgi:hypothetical protein
VAVLGDAAFVAGAALFHGAQSTPGRICTDHGGVKVVDLSNPAAPTVKSQISIVDPEGIGQGPKGNPRRNAHVPNVSSSVSSVSALQYPDGRKVLAIATQRCEQSFFSGARIEFWGVSNLNSPTKLGSYAEFTTGGIIEDVRMFTRADRPDRVFAVATLPFTGSNGEFRLLDVSNPAAPAKLESSPTRRSRGPAGRTTAVASSPPAGRWPRRRTARTPSSPFTTGSSLPARPLRSVQTTWIPEARIRRR